MHIETRIPELRIRIDKLIGGARIQNLVHKKDGIGTLGCIVFDVKTGVPMGLTNRHILADKIGTTVIQPAQKERKDEFIIGRVVRKGKNSKYTDYAVFELDLNLRNYDRINSIYELKGLITGIKEPSEGLKVQKVGQNTGRTYGIVSKIINGKGAFKIKPNPDKSSTQISQGGDSGSLWVTDEPDFKAVGLHISGEKRKRWWRKKRPDTATAINISKVLEDLDVRF